MRNPTIWFPDHVRHRSCCTSTQADYTFDISDQERKDIVLIMGAKTKALSCAAPLFAHIVDCTNSSTLCRFENKWSEIQNIFFSPKLYGSITTNAVVTDAHVKLKLIK